MTNLVLRFNKLYVNKRFNFNIYLQLFIDIIYLNPINDIIKILFFLSYQKSYVYLYNDFFIYFHTRNSRIWNL